MDAELDKQAVVTLKVPAVDKAREFEGLSNLKMKKKERHMKTLREFAKFLEVTNENVVQNVLRLSREFRETIEVLDEDLAKFTASINEDNFLIPKSEKDLISILNNELKVQIENRGRIVETFAFNLDNTETERAEITGVELKRLVDKLIAIAHQLPDDIEHIVEGEAYELNTEIITNKNVHAQTMAGHQIKQVIIEAESLQKWEDSRMKWRQLRHDKALNDFRAHIGSSEFTDPSDRQVFMKRFRAGQEDREKAVRACLDRLLAMTCEDINSDAVAVVQADLAELNTQEINAIQSCYNELIRLQADNAYTASERVEALRRELHVYGALKIEPDLHGNAIILQNALDDDRLGELWRLGGGLKPEFVGQVADLRNEDVIYDRMVVSMDARMELIVSSFTLKGILEERGRLAQLDKVRGFITKMRTAPRTEVAGVLRSLLPDLKDIEEIERIPILFKEQVRGIVAEMEEELASVDAKLAASGLTGATTPMSRTQLGATGASGGTKALGTAQHAATAGVGGGGTKALGASAAHSATNSATVLGGTKTKRNMDSTVAPVSAYADPTLVKAWNRKLGILYFGSDLPLEYQEGCLDSLRLVREQKQCNELVDAVVLEESEVKLLKMDKNYKKLTDSITTYLENQASLLAQTVNNLGDFFLSTAKMVEAHRQQQKALDDKSADEIWDLKEEFRFEKEDREAAYEAACQKIRESTKQDELQTCFEEVLQVLEGIQQSYRTYHSNACFANDRYPLMLIHELRGFVNTLAKNFFLVPDAAHQIITEYERVFDQTIRFNRKYFDENPLAGGMERLPLPGSPPVPEASFQTSGTERTSLTGESSVASPIELLSPYLRRNEAPRGVCTGSYYWVRTFDSVASNFMEEGAFAPPEPVAEVPVTEGEQAVASDTPELEATAAPQPPEPHPDCSFIAAICPVLPISNEKLEKMEEEERENYERAISKHFIDLGNPEDIPPEPEAPAKPAKGAKAAPVVERIIHPLSLLTPDMLNVYVQTKQLSQKTVARLALEADIAYILSHPPLDPNGSSWVRLVKIVPAVIQELVANIRDSIMLSVEKEAFMRTSFAEKQSFNSKAELTDQLEDQIRNHWPRRGRVETQIKQPREAELLGHKEKTWRHISAIQQKMIQAQENFGNSLSAGRNECNTYINDMTALRNSLSGDFKNLAFIQAIDVKARGVTLSFQASSAERIAVLAQIAQVDTDAIISFARDFRKICPPQVQGVEGGYSESEILEIEALVEQQCAEIQGVSAEWQTNIKQLEEEQMQSLKCQEEFAAKYKKVTQDVAMSEGLGQKYGAPRRRAQERIRTEVNRDERCAGKLDALLAKLEFACSEAERAANNAQVTELSTESYLATSPTKPEVDESAGAKLVSPGFSVGVEQLYQSTINWNLLVQVRLSIQQRVKYLRIMDGALLDMPPLPWLTQDRIQLCSALGADNGASEIAALIAEEPPITLEAVFEEVDKACRQETRTLYESEGLGSVLGAGGVPDALQTWLSESKEKLLGRHGHREKAWKRLWAQVQRSEDILARHMVAIEDTNSTKLNTTAAVPPATAGDDLKVESKYTTKLGAPAVCLRALVSAFIDFAKQDKEQKIEEFSQLLHVWEKGREKHERLLRPRLGSPDMAEELTQLDNIESQRSAELVDHVGKFRTLLVRSQTDHLMKFLDDLAVCGNGFIQLLDSTLRQEQLQVPPDTAIPKKHMTLKKLRKAQRIREQVAQGGEDRSQVRLWDGIDTEFALAVVHAAEDLVLDLGKNPRDTAITPSASAAAAPAPPDKKDAKKAAAAAKNAPPPEPAAPPSLMPPSWAAALKEKSTVKGQVSTAHRIVISERDAAVAKFSQYLAGSMEDVRSDYDTILRQEASWNERWKRQVDMLRQGNM